MAKFAKVVDCFTVIWEISSLNRSFYLDFQWLSEYLLSVLAFGRSLEIGSDGPEENAHIHLRVSVTITIRN